jgi:hypothetical protein
MRRLQMPERWGMGQQPPPPASYTGSNPFHLTCSMLSETVDLSSPLLVYR